MGYLTNNNLYKYVSVCSVKLTYEQLQSLSSMFLRFNKCKQVLFNRLCGIRHLVLVHDFITLRNKLKKNKVGEMFKKQYSFLDKHWIMALKETCNDLTSMWSYVARQIRTFALKNQNIDDNELHYIYLILRIQQLWQGVLLHNINDILDKLPNRYQAAYLNLLKNLTIQQKLHADSYICRLTRRYKVTPHTFDNNNHYMTFDQNMYAFKKREFRLISDKSRKRFTIKLKSDWHYNYTGNILVCLDLHKKRINVIKPLIFKKRKLPNNKQLTGNLGVDKGLATLFSCSSEHEYGAGFGTLSYHESRRIEHINNKRSYYFKRIYNIKDQLDKLPLHKTKKQQIKYNKLLRKYYKLKLHVSNKRYTLQHQRYLAHIQAFINHAVYQLINTDKPANIAKEDLTWRQSPMHNSKKQNDFLQYKTARQQLNSWEKGRIDKTLTHICEQFGITLTNVNAAYTSQYCPNCGAHFKKRGGLHNARALCPNCGWMNANISASKMILSRLTDPDITRYTSARTVKNILDKRLH